MSAYAVYIANDQVRGLKPDVRDCSISATTTTWSFMLRRTAVTEWRTRQPKVRWRYARDSSR